MRIRHLIAATDVDEHGQILAPERARHGVVVGGRIAELAGEIDPATHLNLDFLEHRLEGCLVAAALFVGEPILADEEGWLLAWPPRTAFAHRGAVDIGKRRVAWTKANQRER